MRHQALDLAHILPAAAVLVALALLAHESPAEDLTSASYRLRGGTLSGGGDVALQSTAPSPTVSASGVTIGQSGPIGTSTGPTSGIILRAGFWPIMAGAAALPDSDGDGIPDHQECGDISGDGFVNTIDARLIQRCAVGESLPGICENPLCDATGEGDCNTIDARLVQRLAVGDLTKADLHCAERP